NCFNFFFQAEDGIRDKLVTGVQTCALPIFSMQPHYNLLNREEEREMLGLCLAEGIGVLPWSPLARGRLTRAWESQSSTTRSQTRSEERRVGKEWRVRWKRRE